MLASKSKWEITKLSYKQTIRRMLDSFSHPEMRLINIAENDKTNTVNEFTCYWVLIASVPDLYILLTH